MITGTCSLPGWIHSSVECTLGRPRNQWQLITSPVRRLPSFWFIAFDFAQHSPPHHAMAARARSAPALSGLYTSSRSHKRTHRAPQSRSEVLRPRIRADARGRVEEQQQPAAAATYSSYYSRRSPQNALDQRDAAAATRQHSRNQTPHAIRQTAATYAKRQTPNALAPAARRTRQPQRPSSESMVT